MVKSCLTMLVVLLGVAIVAPSVIADLVLTLSHDGSNGVIATVSGTGTMSTASLPVTEPTNRLLVDDLGPGDPFNGNLNFVTFNLATPLAFAPGIDITQIIADDDGGAAIDDIFLPLSNSLSPTPVAFNASGSSLVVGLSFSDLQVGSYSNPSHPVSAELGGFTLNIVSVPEPSSFHFIGLAGGAMSAISGYRKRYTRYFQG